MGIDWIVLSYLPILEGQLTHFQCTNKILKISDLKFIVQGFWETGNDLSTKKSYHFPYLFQ